MTKLVALAGASRSGKGTCARVFAERALELGITSYERQLSDNGKWSLARIFRPTISRVEAVAWFEKLKKIPYVDITLRHSNSEMGPLGTVVNEVPLQKFLQHGLQEGGRDIFGEDLWIDRIIPVGLMDEGRAPELDRDVFGIDPRPNWHRAFFDHESGKSPTDVAIISDLRQPNEAQRVLDIGGIVIQCIRPKSSDEYVTGGAHITERSLPSQLVNDQIINGASLEALEQCARRVFDEVVFPLVKASA